LKELEHLYFQALETLLDRRDATAADEAVNVLAAQFLDALAAARTLLDLGYLRAAYSQIRTMIESRIVMEYLHGDTERAKRWSRASTPGERRRFSFEAIYRENEKADFWKDMWDSHNEIIHTNRGALPAQSRLRPAFGIDTYIGPFYDPRPLANTFLIVLGYAQWFGGLIQTWYGEHPLWPSSFQPRFDAICSGYGAYAQSLQERADQAQELVDRQLGTLPLQEQIQAASVLGYDLNAGRRPQQGR
jgi:hypothetical protein